MSTTTKAQMHLQHLPSIEALTDVDDSRLLAELEVREALVKLTRLRGVVDRVCDRLSTILATGDFESPPKVDVAVLLSVLTNQRNR